MGMSFLILIKEKILGSSRGQVAVLNHQGQGENDDHSGQSGQSDNQGPVHRYLWLRLTGRVVSRGKINEQPIRILLELDHQKKVLRAGKQTDDVSCQKEK